jgi:hypothetical protein
MIFLVRWLLRRYRTRKQDARPPLTNHQKGSR